MIENFGLDRKTLNNWENDPSTKRYVLYRTLEAIPAEFVENIKKQIKEKEANELLLKGNKDDQ